MLKNDSKQVSCKGLWGMQGHPDAFLLCHIKSQTCQLRPGCVLHGRRAGMGFLAVSSPSLLLGEPKSHSPHQPFGGDQPQQCHHSPAVAQISKWLLSLPEMQKQADRNNLQPGFASSVRARQPRHALVFTIKNGPGYGRNICH